jgi:hypothetical protein
MDLLQPKEIEIDLPDGDTRTYIISKFPAVEGREIVAKYPLSALPKLGDYQVSEDIMLKLMCFVAVDNNGKPLRLTTRALVNNHIGSWEILAKIEMAMMEYNCSFFTNGKALTSLNELCRKAAQKISIILTDLSGPSSTPTRQPSMNSEQSTH